MKAPTDKRNDTIQILITRSCSLFKCSNCTQLLPFRKDETHMSPDVFRLALRSLEGWPGIRGIFGGNPPNHPKFADLMQILVEEVPDQRHRGIWTNDVLKHGDLIREVFYPHGWFNCNAHADEEAAKRFDKHLPGKIIETSRSRHSWHSQVIGDYADWNIPESEWVKAREKCDINQDWSAAIMERDGKPYAYFCEVAGAIDGMRGENNGIEAVPGWWAWKMDKFGDQVKKCCDHNCVVPLRRLGHLDRDDTYDYTPSMAEYVQVAIDKGKIKGHCHGTIPVGTEKATDYQAHRTSKPGAT